MPINTTHPTYDVGPGDMTSDAYNGNVKCYVEKLQMQSQRDYEAYVNRACYFNVTKRTTDALIGSMLRKPYTSSIEDIHVGCGQTFDTMLSYVLRDIFLTSRVGILVDYDDDKDSPCLIPYNNNCITNWGDDFVVLEETFYQVDPKDKYKKTIRCQYRELTLVDGVYTVNIWRQEGGQASKKWYIAEQYVPTARGQTLDFIPFVFINDRDTTDECRKPVMYNMAQLNISHFRTTADIEQCAHFLALPQPYISGDFADDVTQAALGGQTLWRLEQGSSVGYLEYSGKGIDSLKDIRESKEAQMASIGSRMFAKAGVESAEALRIRSEGENATLVSMVNALEQGMQIALQYYAIWMGVPPESVEFYMNRDFTNVAATPEEINALLTLFSAGQISQETFLQRLYEGEIVDDVDTELERLNSTTV